MEPSLGMTEEELNELSLDLLREWFMTTIQALSDAAGEEAAIQKYAPYMTNAGIALSQNIPRLFNIQERNLETNAGILGILNFWQTNTTFSERKIIGKREFRSKGYNCWTKGSCWPICKMWCDHGAQVISSSFCPGLEWRMTGSMGQGHPHCSWSCVDTRIPDDGDRTEHDFVAISAQEELRNDLTLHFLGEDWTIAIRAFLDFTGSEETINILNPYMRHSGLSAGILLSRDYEIGNDLASLKTVMDIIGRMHRRKGKIEKQDDSLECTIDECPFSDGPMELCAQYESFFGGLIEAINPEYEFVYNRMMTKGDKACHWVIRKKGEKQKAIIDPNAQAEDDPLKVLKLRFAKGEITKEEYSEMRKLILED